MIDAAIYTAGAFCIAFALMRAHLQGREAKRWRAIAIDEQDAKHALYRDLARYQHRSVASVRHEREVRDAMTAQLRREAGRRRVA